MSATIELNSHDGIRTGLVPPQAVSGAGTYDLVATVINRFGAGLATLTGTVGGAGPLTGFKISRAALPGGTHHDLLTDQDFSASTALCPFASTNAWQTPSGEVFQIVLDLSGAGEIKLFARSTAGATVAVEIGY